MAAAAIGRLRLWGTLVVSGVVVSILPVAQAAAPEPLRTNRVDEVAPSVGGNHLAWSQNKKPGGRHFHVFVKRGDDKRYRVNAPGTRGIAGGIDGSTLVFQRIKKGSSDLRLFDLNTKRRSKPGPAFNTKHWEWRPTISGGWILFGRENLRNGVERVILRHLETGDERRLWFVKGRRKQIYPGQVNGDWAVWSVCTPKIGCKVFRYRISTETFESFAPPEGRFFYGAAVRSNGVMYHVRSRSGCGAKVALIRRPLQGPAEPIHKFKPGFEVSLPYFFAGGGTSVLAFDRYVCKTGRWDLYKIVDP